MNPTLVFDIETIPDIAGLRSLYELDSAVNDKEVAEMAFQMRRQKTGSDFLQHHLHRVAAISCVLREGDNFKVWTLGEPDEDEGSLIQRFFDGIEKYTPQIVSWNGGGFDLPVLHYRGRTRQTDRLPRQAGHGRQQSVGGVPARQARRNPQLLRDRRGEHLSRVRALSVDARTIHQGALPAGMRVDPHYACQIRRTALERIFGTVA